MSIVLKIKQCLVRQKNAVDEAQLLHKMGEFPHDEVCEYANSSIQHMYKKNIQIEDEFNSLQRMKNSEEEKITALTELKAVVPLHQFKPIDHLKSMIGLCGYDEAFLEKLFDECIFDVTNFTYLIHVRQSRINMLSAMLEAEKIKFKEFSEDLGELVEELTDSDDDDDED
jgi:hypothetical protein